MSDGQPILSVRCYVAIRVVIRIHHGININRNTESKVKHGRETQENLMISLYLFKSAVNYWVVLLLYIFIVLSL